MLLRESDSRVPPRHLLQGTGTNVRLGYNDEPSPGFLSPVETKAVRCINIYDLSSYDEMAGECTIRY